MGLFDGCGSCCPSLCFRPKSDNVTALDFSHHCLEDVPNNVFSHERTLEELCLDSNQIRDLPRALFHCEGLFRLYLSDNELQSIPSAISSLTKLQELNISKNHILQIPDSIKSCKCLTVVDASINPLGPRLPDGFTQLINLEELYLNDAFLEFLPANFGRLSRLKIVELRENHLKVLPKSMSRLVELRRLDIGQNDFLEFPEVIGSLHKLSELWCDCNRILSIPDAIGNLKNLTYLDISYNKVEEISPQIGECLTLTDLTLTSNNLIELPETVANLVNLNVLRIDENEIKSLSTSIGSLVSLEEFVFKENEIEILPPNIGLLRNLQTLIGDYNRLIALPDSIGSCISLRILSLAGNQLKVIPDEIGRLSSLKVLNLNSNFLTYLPISLTKITNLQALWLSENQTKPLVQLQTDIDSQTNQKVLTCFLLPQIPLQSKNSPKSIVSPNDSNANSLSDKQMIKFSNDSSQIDDDIDDRITTKLIRAPTPYPKELKAHARHARNLALKQKEPIIQTMNSEPSVSGKISSDATLSDTKDQIHREVDPKMASFEIKEAKVSKAVKPESSVISDLVKRPTSLPINSSFSQQKNSVNSSNLELVANKISQLLREDEIEKSDDSSNKSSHERKSSYKVAVNNSSASMKSPIERKIKSKNIPKEDNERGYKSDAEFYSKDKTSVDVITGYSSDCEFTSKRLDRLKQVVPKEFDSDSALIQMPYESNWNKRSDFDSQKEIKTYEMKDISNDNQNYPTNSEWPETTETSSLIQNSTENSNYRRKTGTPSDLSTDKKKFGNPIDVNSNSSIGSLYPSSGSERPVSVCSGRRSHSIETSNGSANPSTNTSQCSLPRNESTNAETNNQFTALPIESSNYVTQSEPEIGVPVVSSGRLKHPQTASSQFIFHKFSHDFYTQPKPLIGQNSTSHTVFGPEDINSKNFSNGINVIQDSNQTNGSSTSTHQLNKSNIISTLSNRFISNSSAHVFPVIIVKNPGLGFNIESGSHSNRSNDPTGIFVSSVEPAGSASTALKVGDRILQIDGIDLQNVTKDKANHIFESTGNTISLMVSREKF